MSEWVGHVYCTCFRDGLTSEPPLPRSELTINRFGVVTLIGSTDHSEDPEELWRWRVGMRDREEDDEQYPCRHAEMKLVGDILYFPGCWAHEPDYPFSITRVEDQQFPLLRDLFARGAPTDFPSGGIWVVANEAPQLLLEARRLRELLPRDRGRADAQMVATLIRLLDASARTGNPVITHYNGIVDGAW